MNKYTQRFALWLIRRAILKIERNAFRAWQMKEDRSVKKFVLTEYIANPDEYFRLRDLKLNIESIDSPWQGVFAPYWTRDAKVRPEFSPEKEVYPEGSAQYQQQQIREINAAMPVSEEEEFWKGLKPDVFWEIITAGDGLAKLDEAYKEFKAQNES